MESVELEPIRCQLINVGHRNRAAKGAGRAKSAVVDQHDEHVGGPLGGRSGTIGGYFVSGSLASKVVNPTCCSSGIGRMERWISSELLIVRFPLMGRPASDAIGASSTRLVPAASTFLRGNKHRSRINGLAERSLSAYCSIAIGPSGRNGRADVCWELVRELTRRSQPGQKSD
jgi:hypothetical protein